MVTEYPRLRLARELGNALTALEYALVGAGMDATEPALMERLDELVTEADYLVQDHECEGHEPDYWMPQGVTAYCDGTCRRPLL